MATFKTIDREDFILYAERLFSILAANMADIAPTGNSYDDDYSIWCENFGKAALEDYSTLVLILDGEAVIGFFNYYVKRDIFHMNEIQLERNYHSKEGIFRGLYTYVLDLLPPDIHVVTAYANKQNFKSNAILRHLGLCVVGENSSGSCYRYEGTFSSLLEWYESNE